MHTATGFHLGTVEQFWLASYMMPCIAGRDSTRSNRLFVRLPARALVRISTLRNVHYAGLSISRDASALPWKTPTEPDNLISGHAMFKILFYVGASNLLGPVEFKIS